MDMEAIRMKDELLNGLQDEYRAWLALLDAIGPERIDRPGVAGNWSIKDIVAHLTGWRRRTVGRLQVMARGEPEPPPPWPAELQTDDEINDWIYRTSVDQSAREVLDDSDAVFRQMVAALAALPEATLADASRLPWMEGQPFTAAAFFGHFHEEHEADMRAWLAQQGQA